MSERPPNYYDELGVSPGANPREIRSAYIKLAKVLHPDPNFSSPEAVEAFKNLGRIYSILSDPKKRAKHDEDLRKAGFVFRDEEPYIGPEARIIRNADVPRWGYPTATSDYDDFIEVELDLNEDGSFRRGVFVEVAIRLLGTLFWLGAAAGCYFVAPYITKPFQDVTSFGGDMVALIAGIFRLIVYIAIPACVIMGGYVLFHRRQD